MNRHNNVSIWRRNGEVAADANKALWFKLLQELEGWMSLGDGQPKMGDVKGREPPTPKHR
jgi:hypothetical protein